MLLAIFFTIDTASSGQAVPAVTGSPGVSAHGTLHYDLRYSQAAQFYGSTQGNSQSVIAVGDVTYANANTARPFNLTYSGGDAWTIDGYGSAGGIFQHLMASKGVVGRSWSATLSDDVNYLPQAATTGFSGIPGAGSLPASPSQPSQPVLTLNTRSVSNSTTANFTHGIGNRTNLGAGGSYAILRFPDGNGLETDQLQLLSQMTKQLNALNSISGIYSYSRFSYEAYIYTMVIHTAQFGYQRTWSRRFKTSVSAGPEWEQSSSSQIPSSTGLSANAVASYEARSTSASLSYSQSTTGGAGVATEIGVHNRDLSAALSRQFGGNLNVRVTGADMHTQSLTQVGATNAIYGETSFTRKLGRAFSVFANYTAIDQSSGAALPANAVNGIVHVISFGVQYSPRDLQFRK
jgi:hypothetical protein